MVSRLVVVWSMIICTVSYFGDRLFKNFRWKSSCGLSPLSFCTLLATILYLEYSLKRVSWGNILKLSMSVNAAFFLHPRILSVPSNCFLSAFQTLKGELLSSSKSCSYMSWGIPYKSSCIALASNFLILLSRSWTTEETDPKITLEVSGETSAWGTLMSFKNYRVCFPVEMKV